jgi:hypothetical protein
LPAPSARGCAGSPWPARHWKRTLACEGRARGATVVPFYRGGCPCGAVLVVAVCGLRREQAVRNRPTANRPANVVVRVRMGSPLGRGAASGTGFAELHRAKLDGPPVNEVVDD